LAVTTTRKDPEDVMTTMAVGRRALQPFRARRTWAELLYVPVAAVLGAAGFTLLLASLYGGALLAITVIGLPLVAATLRGAHQVGRLHRALARRLLGVEIADPPPPARVPGTGFVGWVWGNLRDLTGWRVALYLFLAFPAALLTLVATVVVWLYGLAFAVYPFLRLAQSPSIDADGVAHYGLQLWNGVYLDSVPAIALVTLVGIAMLAVAPRALHGVLGLQRLLVRGLLGPTDRDRRMVELERSRTLAVDDAAASLRRIERDLHDGAQARMVAVTMRLGMAADELDPAPGEDPAEVLARTRALVAQAQEQARLAVAELRDLARGIHPPVLDRGLDAALTGLAARSALAVDVTVELPERPSPSIESMVYFCAAELLTNVAKHAPSAHATLTVTSPRPGRLRLRVRDDGPGGATMKAGSGLRGLADRVATVDGRLDLASPAGGPTVVTVDLPAQA
jgi:signal transduction histidine kinase